MTRLSCALFSKRIDTGQTQKEVAKLIGVSAPIYNLLEQGRYKRTLTARVIGKLSAYLDLPSGKIIQMYKEEK